jgi:hypothetical protein
MAFSISQIVNKFLNTRNYKQHPNGEWMPDRIGRGIRTFSHARYNLPEGGLIVYEGEGPCVIESLEFSVNGPMDVSPQVFQYGGSGGFTNLFVFTNHLAYRTSITARQIGIYGTNWFDIRHYDANLHRYAFSLKRPIEMPAGAVIRFGYLGDHDTETLVAYHIVVREV